MNAKTHAASRFGADNLQSEYAYPKTNPSVNYLKEVDRNAMKIGLTTNEYGMYMQPCSAIPSEPPAPFKPYISVAKSAAVTPKALLPRTINYTDRIEADSFYMLCQYNRAFYKEIPTVRPWDYTFFSCGSPLYEEKNLTQREKIRQEVAYKHPYVQPVTLCRTFNYDEKVGKHHYVPNIYQGVDTSYIS
ncbi:Hypothetical protein NTJ_15560 [Nesidiocoris tenuis]|uniref:Uncharacterized protein n=1 Tax=Nesidiocoris tenuis TaxID=355587 RepID=A0ABN7BEH9_9HEMI|nr:Hypothetical protein NTJ_15560 [Nesidiocoris tenuis]